MKRKLVMTFSIIGFLLLLAGASAVFALESGRLNSIALAQFLGETIGDRAGWSVAIVGDVNGDGYADMVVGAPNNNGGAAYLILGSPDGWGLNKSLAQYPIIKFSGTGGSEGFSVAGAGDINGDGYNDILVGAPLDDSGTGASYLVIGGPSLTSTSLSTAIKYSGEAVGDQAGWTVAGAGDVNADDYDDFLVGAPSNLGGTGATYLVLGGPMPSNSNLSTAIKYSGESVDNNAGNSIAGVGDFNGDNYDDILVGAYRNNGNDGAAYLVMGVPTPVSVNLSTAIKYFGASGEHAGWSVAGAGDVNGDSFADMVIGSYDSVSNVGRAYLIWGNCCPSGPGPNVGIEIDGEEASDGAGYSVAGAGDFNGDGYDDLLVGAPYNNNDGNSGAAYLVLGGPSLANTNLVNAIKYGGVAVGGVGFDHVGFSMAGVGDVDGDGFGDLLLGGYGNYVERGAAYLVASDGLTSGNLSYRKRQRTWTGGVKFELAGVYALITNSLIDSDITVTRHIFHPCSTNQRLAMPIWTVESAKLDASSQVSLQFKYNNNSIAGMNEANLKLWTRPSGQICADWIQVPGSAVDANTNRISASGLAGLGQFTIADSPPEPTAIESGSINASSNPGMLSSALGLIVMLGAGSGMALWRYRQERIR